MISIRTARSSPRSIVTFSIAAAESEWMFCRPRSNGTRERPFRHVERIGDPDDACLERNRISAAAVPDDRVQRLGRHDGALRFVIASSQQLVEFFSREKQAVGLVVGAVYRHPRVVEQAGRGDHHFRIARLHVVVGDDVRLQAPAVEEPEEPQADVDDDLDVDPGVVRHAQTVGVHLCHVPPRFELVVLVYALEELLEFPVAARRHIDPRGLCGFARRLRMQCGLLFVLFVQNVDGFKPIAIRPMTAAAAASRYQTKISYEFRCT